MSHEIELLAISLTGVDGLAALCETSLCREGRGLGTANCDEVEDASDDDSGRKRLTRVEDGCGTHLDIDAKAARTD